MFYTMVPVQWSEDDRCEVFCSVYNFPPDEPVDSADEDEDDDEEEEATDVHDQRAKEDQTIDGVDDGYNADNEGKGG